MSGNESSFFSKKSFLLKRLFKILLFAFSYFCVLVRYKLSLGGDAPLAVNYIVSLTTTSYRIETVHRTILSILSQSVRPKEIILWISDSAFGNDRGVSSGDIPNKLKEICAHTNLLKIEYCPNLGPHRKLIPTLNTRSGVDVITADDDMLYPSKWAEALLVKSRENPNSIICHRARKVIFDENQVIPYEAWPLVGHEQHAIWLMPIHCDGVLYPSKLAKCYELLTDSKKALETCPFADDIWFRHCLLLEGISVFKVGEYKTLGFDTGFLSEHELWRSNLGPKQGNDKYIDTFKDEWLLLKSRI
jgi:hypothetical protein